MNQAEQGAKRSVPDDQVEPRTTRATEAPQGQRIWTGQEISQFYRDKTAGRYGAEELNAWKPTSSPPNEMAG